MERKAVLDTSAILTLFSALETKRKKLEEMELVTPECVEKELLDFAKTMTT